MQVKNQLHPSCLLSDIAKTLQTFYFGYFGHTWLPTPQVILSTCRKRLCLSADKKSTSPSVFSGDTATICKLLILGTLGMSGYTKPK